MERLTGGLLTIAQQYISETRAPLGNFARKRIETILFEGVKCEYKELCREVINA